MYVDHRDKWQVLTVGIHDGLLDGYRSFADVQCQARTTRSPLRGGVVVTPPAMFQKVLLTGAREPRRGGERKRENSHGTGDTVPLQLLYADDIGLRLDEPSQSSELLKG